jgi:nucleoside-diphosphate-sugar epimerase/predicted dehydrogenase
VGAGYIAPYHVQALARLPQVRLVGVTDLDQERARRLATEHGGLAVFPGLAAMAEAGVDVVHVLTPPQAHAAVALDAMGRGCDVLIEKPLATSVEDCDRLIAEAARLGRRVGVNHSLLGDPEVRRALAQARAGRLGDVVSAEYFCSSVYPDWSEGPVPPQYREGGYPFRDLGVHGLYLMHELLGEILDVDAAFHTHGGDPNLCFDEWHAVVRCVRGTGRIFLSWNVRPMQTVLTVHGTRATVRADIGHMYSTVRRVTPLPKAAERMLNALQDGLPAAWAVPRNVARFASGRLRPYQGLRDFVATFYEALETGAELPGTLEAGRSVVRWVETAARPADTAKAERLARYRASGTPAVVVTGAAGFLGKRLVARLLAEGERVRVLVRREPRAAEMDPRVEVALGDLGDRDAVDQVVRGATLVYHLGAAMQGGWADHQRGTIGGTRHVIDACLAHAVPRLVYVSSLSVLHNAALAGRSVDETAPLEPRAEERGHYTQAKLAAERLVTDAVHERGLPGVVVRPGAILGEGTPLAALCGGIGAGGRLIILGTGEMTLPLVHAADVVAALLLAAARPAADGTILHVVVAAVVTQRELAREVGTARGLRVVHLPQALVLLLARILEALGRKLGRAVPLTPYRLASAQADLRFDCARAQADLGWSPRVGVRPGLRRLIEAERSAIDGDGPGIARREEEAESPPRIPSTA